MNSQFRQTGSGATVARMPDQQELIQRAQAGDGQAFSTLYAMHKRRVYSLCLRMVHHVEDAEDLTQEAFLQIYRKLHTFRGESAFSTWLHRVVVNVVLMSLRKRTGRELPLEDMAQEEERDVPQAVLAFEDPELRQSLSRIALERALDHLPPGYRLVFALHDIFGYEHQEAAEMLGCSAGNCKSQLHKARMKLRAVLRNETRGNTLPEAA